MAFFNISSLGPLLLILILIYIRNPFNLSLFPLHFLIDGILTIQYAY